MRLILEENSFKFNEKHFVQTHGIAMRNKKWHGRFLRCFHGGQGKTTVSGLAH